MSKWPSDYEDKVLKDIEKFDGERSPKKTGLIERCMKRYCDPLELHPNPDDEFSQEVVGPNFSVVTDYVEQIIYAQKHKDPIFEEPVIVEKMEPEGYMLINGHHRWFAALRMGIDKMHVQIVNLVHEEDLDRMLQRTENTRRVSFDLNEVLLTEEENEQAEIIDHLFSHRIKERLRVGAPELIRLLQEKGYDVWIYTSGYYSEEYLTDFFSMYEITIDGIANGVNEKRSKNAEEIKRVREKMANKYDHAIHIDNESVLFIDSAEKSYDSYDIAENGDNWFSGITKILDEYLPN